MKTLAITIMAALMLSIGTIVAATPASALTCTELVDGKISCVLEEGTIVVEKLTASAVQVEEQSDHVTIQVGGADNTTTVDNGNVTTPVEEQPTDNGNVTTYPEEPVVEEPMAIPEPDIVQGGDVGVEEPFPVEEPATTDEMIVP